MLDLSELTKDTQSLRFLCLTSFEVFIKVFHQYIWGKNFTFMPFHKVVIQKLENIAFGRNEKQHLYIGIAPRFGKTQITKYFICWSYALNRNCNFFAVSYEDKLVQQTSGFVRKVLTSRLFQELFPIKLSQNTSAKDLWECGQAGNFRACIMGGGVTGFGAGIMESGYGGGLIIDDFMKVSNARSKAEKQSVINQYSEAIKTRLNNATKTPIIIIAQRIAPDDLIGYIQNTEGGNWDFCVFPALDENGKSIWEDKMPTSELETMRKINPFKFFSQYQQNPVVEGGGVFKREWWQYYSTRDTYQYQKVYITADTAMKTKEWNDFTAIGCFGRTTTGKVHLLDLLHGKYEAPELEIMLKAFYDKWHSNFNPVNKRCTAVYIEDKASGTGLIQQLKRKGGYPIIPIKPDKDKYSRALDAIPYIFAGSFLLPDNEHNPISREVLAEAEEFTADMSHKHDDIIDCLCYGIDKGFKSTGAFF